MVSWQGREVISLFINPRLLSFGLTAGMTPTVGPTWWVAPFSLNQQWHASSQRAYPIVDESIDLGKKKLITRRLCNDGTFLEVCRSMFLRSQTKKDHIFETFSFFCCYIDLHIPNWSVLCLCQSKVKSLIAFSSFCLQMACMLFLSPLARWPWLACWQSSLTRWVGTWDTCLMLLPVNIWAFITVHLYSN